MRAGTARVNARTCTCTGSEAPPVTRCQSGAPAWESGYQGGKSPRCATQSVIFASHVPSLSLSVLLCKEGAVTYMVFPAVPLWGFHKTGLYHDSGISPMFR